jgi:hypothetical protein
LPEGVSLDGVSEGAVPGAPGVETPTLGTDRLTLGVDTLTPGIDTLTLGTETLTLGNDTDTPGSPGRGRLGSDTLIRGGGGRRGTTRRCP